MNHLILALALIPGSIDFGPVPVGAWVTRSISVMNIGKETISNIKADMFPYTFRITNNCTEPLESGASCRIDVHYIPMQPAIESGWLDVAGSDGEISSASIFGQGY